MPRGVRYKFSPGDYALCFEPDDKKAKVLYTAKVVDVSVKREDGGQRTPAYHIHFQGWNNNWDRWVPETMLLEDTDFNRALMQRCQKLVRHARNRHDAREQVSQLLSRVQHEAGHSDWTAVTSHEDGRGLETKNAECEDAAGREDLGALRTATVTGDEQQAVGAAVNESGLAPGSSADELKAEESEDDSDSDDRTVHARFVPELPAPAAVRAYLEADWRRVKSFSRTPLSSTDDTTTNKESKHVLPLPIQPSVCAILEQYLEDFSQCHGPPCQPHHLPLQVRETTASGGASAGAGGVAGAAGNMAAAGGAASASHTTGDALGPQYAEADADFQLCYETVSSLRVLFDFVAEPRLLIDEERPSFHEMSSVAANPVWINNRCNMSANRSNCPSRAAATTASLPGAADAVNELASYPLLPRDASAPGLGPPAPPSAFLGLPHLLRMLVCLPELLEHLEKLGAASRAIILRHARLLLLYLEDRLEMLTPSHLLLRSRKLIEKHEVTSDMRVAAIKQEEVRPPSPSSIKRRKKAC